MKQISRQEMQGQTLNERMREGKKRSGEGCRIITKQEKSAWMAKKTWDVNSYTPWVKEYLQRSIWKEDNRGYTNLKYCRTKELEGKTRTISIHMGKPLLAESIDVLNLSVRSYNCLKRCGISTIEDLMARVSSVEDLMKIRNLGKKSAEEILTKLEDYQKMLLSENG